MIRVRSRVGSKVCRKTDLGPGMAISAYQSCGIKRVRFQSGGGAEEDKVGIEEEDDDDDVSLERSGREEVGDLEEMEKPPKVMRATLAVSGIPSFNLICERVENCLRTTRGRLNTDEPCVEFRVWLLIGVVRLSNAGMCMDPGKRRRWSMFDL
jgi:hypothetical protein